MVTEPRLGWGSREDQRGANIRFLSATIRGRRPRSTV